MSDPLEDAALSALVHFFHMDQANAAIHVAPVRFSPITLALANALENTASGRAPIVTAVLEHRGAYTLDPGL